MNITNKDLKRRIIEISWKHKLSHLGSCLTAVDIIDSIYSIKKHDEKFVLSSGHAALALYCVIEKYSWMSTKEDEPGKIIDTSKKLNAEKIFNHHGVHPDYCEKCHIDCSTGSLGNGLPIAVGMALADRRKKVYCLISDGEFSEGSIHEALRIRSELSLSNLKVYLNNNGWGAYKKIDDKQMETFSFIYGINQIKTNVDYLPFLKGQDAHYHIMNEEEYKQAMEILR